MTKLQQWAYAPRSSSSQKLVDTSIVTWCSRSCSQCMGGVAASLLLIVLSFAVIVMPATAAAVQPFGLHERVVCQTQVEDLDWLHRLWPEQNQGAKPARSQVISDAEIRAKVATNLSMESALASVYGGHIDTHALQAELDRMARSTRAPDRLKELFRTLENDALAVAECVARPALVASRLHDAYVFDESRHAALKARATAALMTAGDADALRASGATVSTVAYVERSEETSSLQQRSTVGMNLDAREIALTQAQFEQLRYHLRSAAKETRDSLRETEADFVFERVLSESDNQIEVQVAQWAKVDFETWWREQAKHWAMPAQRAELGALTLPSVTGQESLAKVANTWNATAVGGVPAARFDHTAVWTGNEMIVWGGRNTGGSYLNSGGRYNPTTDTWVATSVSSPPSARHTHTVVWTGTVMIVWGGYNGGYLSTGGRYNPASNSWAATQSGTAPTARQRHSAVWTGSSMVVWGGNAGTNVFFDTGSRYNPVNNTWTATSITDAPTARMVHTAVWTGSEMIVWGGFQTAFLNTGGRYDPVSNSWAAVATAGAPTGRWLHTAVWTGSEMIVWGGTDNTAMNTGGRYNPSSNVWQATSLSGAPTGREQHTAVWTGNEMIVWGGCCYQNSGGLYNPILDTWMATSLTSAPTTRERHAAVWTGSKMAVWGGYGGSALDTGGLYEPAATSFALVYVAGSNGSIIGTTTQTVSPGGTGTAVTAVAAANHHFVQWSDANTVNPRVDSNVMANVSVTAQFAIDTYSLSYTAGPNGTLSGATSQTVNHGSNGTAILAVPAMGYRFVEWSDGFTANPRTEINVVTNLSVVANFANDTPSISVVGNRTLLEDSGNQSITVTLADTETAVASLVLTAASAQTGLIPHPVVATTASPNERTVNFAPTTDGNGGPVTISLTVTDSGGASFGRSFTVNVSPVNDAPTLSTGNVAIFPAASSGVQNHPNFASVDLGPSDEDASQFVADFLIDSIVDSSGVLVPSTLDIANNGLLTYELTGVGGTATINVRVRDNGGTADGGENTSTSQQFSISVTPGADLELAKDNQRSELIDGESTVYAIIVANAGPNAVVGARISDQLPSTLINGSWACVQAASTATCPSPGANPGNLDTSIDLGVNQYLRFDVMAQVDGSAGAFVVNTANVSVPAGTAAINTGNDSATDQDPIFSIGVFSDGFETEPVRLLTVPGAAQAMEE